MVSPDWPEDKSHYITDQAAAMAKQAMAGIPGVEQAPRLVTLAWESNETHKRYGGRAF